MERTFKTFRKKTPIWMWLLHPLKKTKIGTEHVPDDQLAKMR